MKTVRVGGLEYILFGDYVAIARSLRVVKQEVNIDGDIHEVWEQVPHGRPFIDFPVIYQADTGEYYVDDDDSIAGGLSTEQARQVAAELLAAAAWLEENE